MSSEFTQSSESTGTSLLAKKAMARLIQCHSEAELSNEWTFFVDEMYAADCVYSCEYAGTMLVAATGLDEIKTTHYGRDMAHGWEQWTFPYVSTYTNEHGQGITHWMNRGPGLREDGRFYETPGISFMDFDQNGKIKKQLDLFDLAHQMRLCDELEAANLLSPVLKESWVTPMKAKLLEMLR